MPDVHDADTRRRNMSAIRARDTTPEIIIRKICHALGYRFRLHRNDLPGKPDLVFSKLRAVIFVHGCFWHGHGCYLFKVPQTRTGFWTDKIDGNKLRDEYQIAKLGEMGWHVLVVWECALKGKLRLEDSKLRQLIDEWLSKAERQSGQIDTEGYDTL